MVSLARYKWMFPRYYTSDGCLFKFSNYLINREGEIRIKKTGRLLRAWLDARGYLVTTLWRNKKRHPTLTIHRLLYSTFVGKIPMGLEVDHVDDNKANNFLDNFQLLTGGKNSSKSKAGEKHPGALLTWKDVYWIKVRYFIERRGQKEIGKEFGVHHNTVCNIINGYRWNPERLTKEQIKSQFFKGLKKKVDSRKKGESDYGIFGRGGKGSSP